MEFLIGRTLLNSIANLRVESFVEEDLRSDPHQEWHQLLKEEPDAGLGNGGLGRLAACFLDSLATLEIPAIGYGLRYEYGMFRQEIRNGQQFEQPDNWLLHPDPWEVARSSETVEISLNSSVRLQDGRLRSVPGQLTHLLGVPYDRPIVGYGGRTINTLRLWAASSPDLFDFGEFSQGEFFSAVLDKIAAESLTKVLYPDDSTPRGRSLRFLQEYLPGLLLAGRHRPTVQESRERLAGPAAEGRHPAQRHPPGDGRRRADANSPRRGAPGLGPGLGADRRHAGLHEPHALARGTGEVAGRPLRAVPAAAARDHLRDQLRGSSRDVQTAHPGDVDRLRRMSLIEETPVRQVRMANLAIVGTHSTNGVAEIHSRLLREKTVADFAEMFPERFNNKTNGVTPAALAAAGQSRPGEPAHRGSRRGVGDRSRSARRSCGRWSTTPAFAIASARPSWRPSRGLPQWVKREHDIDLDLSTIFDSQVKRIHEYKRQLLNVLHIMVLYSRLRTDPRFDPPPRTFLFAGKAAPAYRLAKLIIKLINDVGRAIDRDPLVRGRIKVVFLPNYSVSLAEQLIPASDVSEQISTAGYEASGTSNMKFTMNGALTIGTRDGATIEIAQEVGEENLFLFGLSAEEVASSRSWYNPHWHYEHEPEARMAIDLLFSDQINRGVQGLYDPLRDTLLTHGDHYMHLADLRSYTPRPRSGSARSTATILRQWTRKAILNVAGSGRFSSDRTIREYARDIWDAKPCPVPSPGQDTRTGNG